MLGGRIVKRYRVPSPNQEAILAAFQEEGWPHHIDDPLSPLPDQCPKERLHSTIKYLNASQANRLIRFRGDGTGEGIVWEPVDDQARPAARASDDVSKSKRRKCAARQSSAESQGIRHTPCAAFARRHTECAGYNSGNLLSRSV